MKNNKLIRTVIIDDEAHSRNTLRTFIDKYSSGLEIIGEADSVKTGISLIEENNPELIFLDVQMQDGTGFDLLGALKNRNFRLIFVTSFDQYAIRAFRFSALDYILKPVDPENLIQAIEKVKEIKSSQKESPKIDLLMSNVNCLEKIALPSSDGVRFIKINDIVRCESDNNYTLFFLANKEKLLISRTLKDFETMLSDLNFYRVHKSHLVNLTYVSKYIQGEGGYVILEDGTHVDVSRRKKEGLMKILMGR